MLGGIIMSCNNTSNCGCKFNVGKHGACDPSRITINGSDRTQLNWNEISVPEIVDVPSQKPDIEDIDDVFVDAKIDCVKLIETPFAYNVYERLATPLEITLVTDAINLAVVNIQPIIDAVNAILLVPGLPAIPEVTALQDALTAVTNAAADLTTAINNALTALGAACIAAATLITLIESVQLAIELLQNALDLLIAAANALVIAVNAIDPVIVGPLVEAAVTVLLNAITVVTDQLLLALDALSAAILSIGITQYFALTSNEEGTCLSGRKIIIEGTLKQKVVYTGLVERQSVHSMHNCIPFTSYIIPYAKFEGLTPVENLEVLIDATTCETEIITGFPYDPNQEIVVDLCEEFGIDICIEDIFAYALDNRTVFKNITIFLKARPEVSCG